MSEQQIRQRLKPGRPATGKGEPIQVRMRPEQLAALDKWIAESGWAMTRPEAIRALIAQAMARPRNY